MKRNTSIIISITGITIIVLVLIGFTYGYYLTQISSNQSEKSVSITTGNAQVNYTDLSEDETDIIIKPGTVVTKLFTVQSDPDVSTMAAKYSIFLVDINNEFNRQEDIVYTLYRKSGNNTINTSNYSDCEIILTDVQFPATSISSLVKADEIISKPGDYYTYALVITYKNLLNVNQNIDQGNTFSAKVNIGPSSVYGEGIS